MSNSLTPHTSATVGAVKHWLADENNISLVPGGGTLDPATVEAVDGVKYLPSGTPLGKITASGKWGPYDSAAEDGRQTMVGLLFNTGGINLTGSDAEMCSIFIGGVAREAALPVAITSTMKGHNQNIRYV